MRYVYIYVERERERERERARAVCEAYFSIEMSGDQTAESNEQVRDDGNADPTRLVMRISTLTIK